MNTDTSQHVQPILAKGMAIAVTTIVALMPLHAFLSTWLGVTIGPLLLWKSWKELALLMVAPLAVWACALRPDIARKLWGRIYNRLIAAYVVLHGVLAFVSSASIDAVVAGLMMNLRFLAIFVLVQVVIELRPEWGERARAIVLRWLLWTGVALGILALLQVYVLPRDFLTQFGYAKDVTIAPYILVDQNPDALRAFATLRGPNTLGAYLLLPIAAALYAVYRKRRDFLAWAALALGVAAVYLTGSRSAWLGLMATIVVLALLVVPRRHVVFWAKRLMIPAMVLVGSVGWAAVTVPSVRLAVFHSSPGDSSLLEGSSAQHWEASMIGFMDVVRHPWGSGPGSAGPASFYDVSGPRVAENYYVQIAQEVGVLGLGLFITICVFVIQSIVRRSSLLPAALAASFAGISLVNMLLHGWADDPTALTWWALAGLYAGAYTSPASQN